MIKHRLTRYGYHAGDTQDFAGYVQADRLSALRRLVNCGVVQTNAWRFVPWQGDRGPPSAKLGVLRCGAATSGSVFVLPVGPGFRFQHAVVIQKLGAARRHCPDLPFHATSLARGGRQIAPACRARSPRDAGGEERSTVPSGKAALSSNFAGEIPTDQADPESDCVLCVQNHSFAVRVVDPGLRQKRSRLARTRLVSACETLGR